MKRKKLLSVAFVFLTVMSMPAVAFAATPLEESNFDYQRYADDYADVKEAYGYDKDLLWEHYVNFGSKENRTVYATNGDKGKISWGGVQVSDVPFERFDYMRYANENADLKAAYGYNKDLLWQHYLTMGAAEGRKIYAVTVTEKVTEAPQAAGSGISYGNFDYIRYADGNADLKEAYGYNRVALWNHYQTNGVVENRDAYAVSGATAQAVGRSAYVDGIVAINQNPELPTGCEVTALTIALNWAGYPADKLTLAREYLPKACPGAGISPYEYFIGNPEVRSGYGCYASAIVTCAANYGAMAIDVSGCGFEQLMAYISAGQPVMVWGTMNMIRTGRGSYVYTRPDGVNENWKSNEHCLVMVGYDLDAQTVTMADPLRGAIVNYDMSVFQTRWAEQGYQAVVVPHK